MGGAGQPYMYTPAPSGESEDPIHGKPFDPRAVTRASWAPPPTKPKQEGPLIDFNRHPDSWLVQPHVRDDIKPMSRHTVTRIKIARWTQLSLRVVQMIGAIGLLILAIIIRGMQDAEGWITRIPPGVDIVFACYGIYHLSRTAKYRTPQSSASYHFFGMIVDAGFIAFYVFTSIMCNNNYTQEPGTKGRWRTSMKVEQTTTTILLITWIVAMTVGSFHLISGIFDLYLFLVFRQISHLPPDMNPLEAHLTSRRQTKHKYKNSEATISTMSEKHRSGISTIETQAEEPLISGSRMVPFSHTRQDSGYSYSPHTPESARQSRVNLANGMYQLPQSARVSRGDLSRPRSTPPQPQPLNDRYPYISIDTRSNCSSRNMDRASIAPSSHRRTETFQTAKSHARYDSMAESKTPTFVTSPDLVPEPLDITDSSSNVSEQRRSDLESDNWFVYEEPRPQTSSSSNYSQEDGKEYDPYHFSGTPKPLGMNPPTPPAHGSNGPTAPPTRPLTANSTKSFKSTNSSIQPDRQGLNRSQTASSNASSVSRSPTPKRYYGSLKEATQNLKPVNESPRSSKKGYMTPIMSAGYVVQQGAERQGYEAINKSPRVISRSGIDEGDLGMMGSRMASGGGGAWRRREVSGKVVEEGRSIGGVAAR